MTVKSVKSVDATETQDRALRESARNLLKNEAFTRVLDKMAETCFLEFCASQPQDKEKRESIYTQMLGVNGLAMQVENWANMQLPGDKR